MTSPSPSPTPAVDHALVIDDVSKRYGRRWAVARLSFHVAKGTSLLLTGHNGSGKSTLLRMLAAATAPTAGKIRIFGQDAVEHREDVRTQVALLAHSSFLYEDLTAEQNLLLLARLVGKEKPKDVVSNLLMKLGLSARSDSPIRQFSAGMRKRLAIARLLMKAPPLALLDEPFGELDPKGMDEMEGHIRELQKQGTSVVLATHLVEQGQSLCTERLHLAEGRRVDPS